MRQPPSEFETPPQIFALHEVIVRGPVSGKLRREVRKDLRAVVIETGSVPASVGLDAIEMKLDEIQHLLDPTIRGVSVEVKGAIAGRPVIFNRPLAPPQPYR